MKNIILVGLMGAGKSTVGRMLARQKRMQFYDSDQLIIERTGVDIPTIFEIEGEEGFRDREANVIAELTAKSGIVLATGGGSLLREKNRENLARSGFIIYLRTTPEQLYARIKYDKSRPLMQTENPLQTLRNLLVRREKYYMNMADLIINTGRQRINNTVQQIDHGLQQLEENT